MDGSWSLGESEMPNAKWAEISSRRWIVIIRSCCDIKRR